MNQSISIKTDAASDKIKHVITTNDLLSVTPAIPCSPSVLLREKVRTTRTMVTRRKNVVGQILSTRLLT